MWDRTTALIGDVQINCNAQAAASAYAALSEHGTNEKKTSGYRYIFAVPPGKHGDDIPYSFYSYGINPADSLPANTSVATVLPEIITSLALSRNGVPVSAPSMPLEKYGPEQRILVVNATGISQIIGDPWQSKRCEFWQKADGIQG
jgi:hypothetical protein